MDDLDLTLEQEYTLLSEGGGTLASWEQYQEDYQAVINHRCEREVEALRKQRRSDAAVESRIINYGALVLNGVFTVACPLYAPIGALVQAITYVMTKD